MKKGSTLILSGILFNTIIFIASVSSETHINPPISNSAVQLKSVKPASELDPFKKEIFSKQQYRQDVNASIKELGDTIKGLESRQFESAVQRAELMSPLYRKMDDLIRKLISLEGELNTLQALSNSKQSQMGKDTHENWGKSENGSKHKDSDVNDDSYKYRKEDKKGKKQINAYYVQVGAWKNHHYAQKMLEKIKNYYPDAYIVKHNDFNKIRISTGLKYKNQGVIVSRDIEEKFNIKPLLVQK